MEGYIVVVVVVRDDVILFGVFLAWIGVLTCASSAVARDKTSAIFLAYLRQSLSSEKSPQ